MDKDISIDTTNLQSIAMSSSLAKNTKHFISKDKLNANTTINLQIDELKNSNSRTFPTNSPKPNQVYIICTLYENNLSNTHGTDSILLYHET